MIRLLVKAAIGFVVFIVGLSVLFAIVFKVTQQQEEVRQAQQQKASAEAASRAAKDAAFRRAAAQPEEAILEALTQGFSPMPSGWDSFDIETAILEVALVQGVGQVTLSLNYAEEPLDQADVERDTKRVVGVIQDWLRSLGKEPEEQWINIVVYAKKAGGDQASDPIDKTYGKAVYDFQQRRLEFVPAED